MSVVHLFSIQNYFLFILRNLFRFGRNAKPDKKKEKNY